MKAWKLVLLLIVLGGLFAGYRHWQGQESQVFIDETAIDRGTITFSVETLGTIEPLSTVIVGCETTGKIIEMAVDHDDPVSKDQIICRIDPEIAEATHAQSIAERARTKALVADARVAIEEQRLNLPILTAQAKAQWDESKAALEQAEFNMKRVERLFKDNNAPEAEWILAETTYDRAKATADLAEARYRQAVNNEKFVIDRAKEALEQAEAAAALAEAQFKSTQARVDRCIIKSPIDGIVLKRFEDVGQTVIAALHTPPMFMLAPSLDRMRVNAKVSESDIVHIDEGQKARFKVEGKQTAEFAGQILHKRNQPEIVQGVTTYTVSMEVENDERKTLLPGMSVNVVIDCEHRENTMRISNAALRFKPPIPIQEQRRILDTATHPPEPRTADGQRLNYCTKEYAWTYDRASRQWSVSPLWVGITDNIHTEVLAGAKEGDRFVTKFFEKSSGGFDFKEALRLAQPGQRTL